MNTASQSCRNIIMTGPPGSGKTTLMKRFKGIARIVDEVAREVLKERDAKGWGRGNVQPEIYKRTKAMVEQALGSDDDFILFDRTHIDCLAFGYVPKEPPKTIKDAEVWVLKHHPEWYKQDEERKETAAEAEELGEKLKKVYQDLGYSVREIDAADPSTWPQWVRKRLERRKVGRGTNNRGRIEEFHYDRPTTHRYMNHIIKGITEDMEAVVENREVMASCVATTFGKRIGMNIQFGENGLSNSWQDDFQPTTSCVHCGQAAEIAFVGIEDDFVAVSSLHPNDGKNSRWPHDAIAAAVYICPHCFKSTSEFNQA